MDVATWTAKCYKSLEVGLALKGINVHLCENCELVSSYTLVMLVEWHFQLWFNDKIVEILVLRLHCEINCLESTNVAEYHTAYGFAWRYGTIHLSGMNVWSKLCWYFLGIFQIWRLKGNPYYSRPSWHYLPNWNENNEKSSKMFIFTRT